MMLRINLATDIRARRRAERAQERERFDAEARRAERWARIGLGFVIAVAFIWIAAIAAVAVHLFTRGGQ